MTVSNVVAVVAVVVVVVVDVFVLLLLLWVRSFLIKLMSTIQSVFARQAQTTINKTDGVASTGAYAVGEH